MCHKSELSKATGIDTLDFTKKYWFNLTNLKSGHVKFDINELAEVDTDMSKSVLLNLKKIKWCSQ